MAGHYCPAGSSSNTENRCPPGYYCAIGSGEVADLAKCPRGTYNEGYGATSISDCKDCPAGVQCPTEGLAHAPIYIDPADDTQTDVCSALNDEGAGDIPCPDGIVVCDLGYYCPLGTIDDAAGENAKQLCPKGAKCDGGRSYVLCEPGEYQD